MNKPAASERHSFKFTAGRLVAREIRVGVKTIAIHHGVHLELEEDVGWFETAFFCTVTGTPAAIAKFRGDLKHNFDRWSKDD